MNCLLCVFLVQFVVSYALIICPSVCFEWMNGFVTTEALLVSPTTVESRKKLGVRCPKCGSTRTVTKLAERKFESFECGSCGYA